MPPVTNHQPRFLFRPRHRLAHAKQFDAVYAEKVRKSAGPITVFGRLNDLPHARLGLSIGKRVGGAVARNGLKRRIREAFRHLMPEIETGIDLVVTSSAHEPRKMEQYLAAIRTCIAGVEKELLKRAARAMERERGSAEGGAER